MNLNPNVVKRLTDAITELTGKQKIHFTIADTSLGKWDRKRNCKWNR
ncbi:hypothetical protein [Paenibacillus sp. QZ-Y1]